MDCHSFAFRLLIILSVFFLHSRADDSGSVLFLDSPSHQYFRHQPKTGSMLLPEVGAAVSVLLGFAPPATLSAASSFKLNELLTPNPFDRPRSVFMLEVRGAKDSQIAVGLDNDFFSTALSHRVIIGEIEADIQLPDEDEVSVVSLKELSSFDSYTECSDKELSDFVSWLGGSYVPDALEQLSGELIIPLANDDLLKLHMSKKADREFIASLVSLIRNIRRAMVIHQDLSGSKHKPAELVTGSFDGIKALQNQYGTEGVARQGMELFVTSLSKIFDSLQTAYKGQVVGVILFSVTPTLESETSLNVKFTPRPSPRLLEEKEGGPFNPTLIEEVALVRLTLAWTTGIILIISTLLGIYYLMYMPITRDTLLYSNVKLD